MKAFKKLFAIAGSVAVALTLVSPLTFDSNDVAGDKIDITPASANDKIDITP